MSPSQPSDGSNGSGCETRWCSSTTLGGQVRRWFPGGGEEVTKSMGVKDEGSDSENIVRRGKVSVFSLKMEEKRMVRLGLILGV